MMVFNKVKTYIKRKTRELVGDSTYIHIAASKSWVIQHTFILLLVNCFSKSTYFSPLKALTILVR